MWTFRNNQQLKHKIECHYIDKHVETERKWVNRVQKKLISSESAVLGAYFYPPKFVAGVWIIVRFKA